MIGHRLIEAFSPGRQPMMARPAYARELVTAMTVPGALALLEGSVVGVLARYTFGVGDVGLALIFASPLFANLTSLYWAKLAHGRAKVRVTTTLMLAVLATVTLVALLPRNELGASLLVGLIIVGRCLIAGVITLRSTIWRANFPRHRRAQTTSKFVFIAACSIALVPLIAGQWMDLWGQAFRVMYPLSAAVALLGVASFSRIRVRRERSLLHEERAGIDPQARRPGAWSVLRDDRAFRWYMVWQFIAGLGMMGGQTAFFVVLVDAIEPLEYRNFLGMALNATLPMALAMLTLSAWSRLLDRLHITAYRGVHGLFMIANQSLNLLAAVMLTTSPAVGLMLGALAMGVQGVSRGGGMLAWQLGHNDFADRQRVALYMGVHQTLTGVRGLVAPLSATLLMRGWPPPPPEWAFGLDVVLPGFRGLGAGVFVLTTLCVLIAWVGFVSLSKKLRSEGRGHAADA